MIINGKKVPWLFGESILDSINRAGEYIPSLCNDPAFMDNDSCCRLCMVEVTLDGVTSIVPACATVSDEDQEIVTDTEVLAKARKTLLQLIYAEAPENPVILEIMRKCGVEPNPAIELKGGRDCILCNRCVNACGYWVHGALSSMNRGVKRNIGTPCDEPSDECVGCASCNIVCPIESVECKDEGGKRTIWNKDFDLIYCEHCGKLLTTKENFNDAKYDDAPVLCNECSEKYRIKNRKDHDLYSY